MPQKDSDLKAQLLACEKALKDRNIAALVRRGHPAMRRVNILGMHSKRSR
jgi:hypothetical protein